MAERKCPICGEPAASTDAPAFPFCSKRCRLVDLGNWLGGTYRFEGGPGARAEEDEEWWGHGLQ
jgi:hypothetical protein